MDEKQLQALANELAKNLKTPEDLSQFDRLLKKISVEAALNAEMSHHLGYEKNHAKTGSNARNGYSTKTVTTTDGPLVLRTPCDREATFEPQLLKKNQARITGADNQILSLYAKGMTTREIAAAFKELYDADVSLALVSKVTDAVMGRSLSGKTGHWMQSILLFTLTVLSLRSGRTVASSINPCSWRWVSTSKARRNCRVCGWPKMKARSSG